VEIELREPVPDHFDRLLEGRRSRRDLGLRLDLDQLGAFLAAGGVTGLMQEGDGPIFALRAAPSGGGLYPIDLFIVARNVADLPTSVYYFHPLRNSLVAVPGARPQLISGPGFFGQDWIAEASAIVLLVASFTRNSWKYGERSYRLTLLDAGHVAQNLLMMAQDLDCPACAIGGFHDQLVANELSMDGVTEAVVHAIAIGGNGDDLLQKR
jgi:SagB-type dehydrogenase family enzyme